jgi:UDP-2,3-diacylglucosamine pyrophosphatase LpxH
MHFAVDLISDLHVETWDKFDWTSQPTAPYCVVAGDISKDLNLVIDTLKHLGEQYAGVFYIDGNEEHRDGLDNLESSYARLREAVDGIQNVVFMQDNVVIVNGIALLATNGWWSYDFDDRIGLEESQQWLENYLGISRSSVLDINGVAYHDAAYLINSVKRLQTQMDVKHIVLISHTLPAPWLVSHDIDLANQARFNTLGNKHLNLALDEDTENKVRAWLFGHYHRPIDREFAGIRYVCNPRGRGNTSWSQTPYYPKRIQIEI